LLTNDAAAAVGVDRVCTGGKGFAAGVERSDGSDSRCNLDTGGRFSSAAALIPAVALRAGAGGTAARGALGGFGLGVVRIGGAEVIGAMIVGAVDTAATGSGVGATVTGARAGAGGGAGVAAGNGCTNVSENGLTCCAGGTFEKSWYAISLCTLPWVCQAWTRIRSTRP